jgi:hypothetical protein
MQEALICKSSRSILPIAIEFGTFTQVLYDEAKKQSWTVISMKNDSKRILAWEQ